MVRIDLHGDNATFQIPDIYDANGYEQQQLYGRWFIDFTESTTTLNQIHVIERKEDDPPADPDASTDGDGKPRCPGCYWSASFSVPAYYFMGPDRIGCHQILAVISDSPFDLISPDPLATTQETILARAVWWVWTYEDDSPSPGLEECGEEVEP